MTQKTVSNSLEKKERELLLENLKDRLPFKYMARVQAKLHSKGKTFSSKTIYAVMNGNRPNTDILEALIEVAEENEKKIQELKERMA